MSRLREAVIQAAGWAHEVACWLGEVGSLALFLSLLLVLAIVFGHPVR